MTDTNDRYWDAITSYSPEAFANSIRVAEECLLTGKRNGLLRLSGDPATLLIGLSIYTLGVEKGDKPQQIEATVGTILHTAAMIVFSIHWEPSADWPATKEAMQDALMEQYGEVVMPMLEPYIEQAKAFLSEGTG